MHALMLEWEYINTNYRFQLDLEKKVLMVTDLFLMVTEKIIFLVVWPSHPSPPTNTCGWITKTSKQNILRSIPKLLLYATCQTSKKVAIGLVRVLMVLMTLISLFVENDNKLLAINIIYVKNLSIFKMYIFDH